MELTTQHFIALLPLLVTSATIVVVMLAIAWKRNHAMTFILSVLGLNLALLSLIPAAGVTPIQVTPLLLVDKFACYYMALVLAATLAGGSNAAFADRWGVQLAGGIADHDMKKVAVERAEEHIKTNLAEYLEKGVIK